MLIFLGIGVTLTALIHLYLWQRLVRDTLRDRRWRRLGGWAVLGAALLLVVTLFGDRLLPGPVATVLTWLGYLWLGVMFYLLLTLLALELPVLAAQGLLWWRAARSRRAGTEHTTSAAPVSAGAVAAAPPKRGAPSRLEPDQGRPVGSEAAVGGVTRRVLLRRAAAITAGLVAVGTSGYGVTRAYRTPRVERLTVPLARLDPRADGLRVAVVADLHVSPVYGAGSVGRVVDLLNSLEPDLITLVGDMVTSEVAEVRDALAPLGRLRGRYGVYAVTGNHEYYTGHEEWADAAEELGMRVLRNQRVEIAHRGGAIDLAGVNDQEGGRYADPPDYEAALGDRDPSRPVLLMAHQPVQVHRAAAYGVDLQVSGHTHGGQVFPFDYLVRLEQPVISGLAEVDGTLLYVTDGAGFWGPPMRVGADPDVTLLELRAES